MSTTPFSLASGNFFQNWSNPGLITANDDWSLVPGIVGYLGDISTGTTASVDPRTLTAATLGAVDVIANLTSTTNSSGGVAEFQLSDPTIALQGSGTADAPSLVLYLDATGRRNVSLSFIVRDLDAVDDTAQSLNVQYRLGSGDWINVAGGYFADVTAAGATLVTNVSLTLPAEVNGRADLQVRIMTTNAAGNDEWIGIDDIAVSSDAGLPLITVAATDNSATEGAASESQNPFIVYTLTRSGDLSQALTVTYSLSGTATSADYTIDPATVGTVTFAAGSATATITLTAVDDADFEPVESVTLTLVDGADYDLGAAASADASIISNDALPAQSITLTTTTASATEGTGPGLTEIVFIVSRDDDFGEAVVNYVVTPVGGTSAADFEGGEFPSGQIVIPEGQLTAEIRIQIARDSLFEGPESFTVTLVDPGPGYQVAGAPATGTILDDDQTKIHDIQGTAHFSPILVADGITAFNTNSTTLVQITAVVTAIASTGFYLMEEQSDWDADARTSEGIFVQGATTGLTIGELVTVTGRVREDQITVNGAENLPRTVLVATNITQTDTTAALPTYVLDGTAGKRIPNSILTDEIPDYFDSVDDAGDVFDPENDALDFFETIEGMRVTIPDMRVADGVVAGADANVRFKAYSGVHADADQINSRGGYTIFGDPALSTPDTADTQDNVIRGGRHLHDGDVNPDILELDFLPAAGGVGGTSAYADLLSMGDQLGDVTGVINFDFRTLKLVVTEALDPVRVAALGSSPAQETTTLTADPRSLRVATFNVENLTFGNPDAKFDGLVDIIQDRLLAPDILMIEEIQDDNGTGTGVTTAAQTWQKLVDKLNAATGKVYQWVDQDPVINSEGGQPNGNIRVGFIYDTGRVQLGDLAADASLADRRKWVDRIGDGVRDAGDLISFSDDMLGGEIVTADWSGTRKSLLGEFTFNGNKLFLTANHFPSKGGSGEFWQLNQNIDAGQPENRDWQQRADVAEDVYAMMNLIGSTNPQARIVSGGDFNEFWFYRAGEVLTGSVLANGAARVGGQRFTNLMVSELPVAERYTYTFTGRSQALDYMLSDAALAAVADYDVVHVNTGFNSSGGVNPAVSDHDPSLARFDFRNFGEILRGGPLADIIDGFGGDDLIFGLGGNDTLSGGAGFDTISYAGETASVTVNLTNGTGGGTSAGSDTLATFEAVIGTAFNDTLVGDGAANRLEGGAGQDLLAGRAGADTLIGGSGDDTYVVEDAANTVVELAGGGFDTVFASINYTLPANVEVLSLTGTGLTATGTGGADQLVSQQNGNTLAGLGGDDVYVVRGTGIVVSEAANAGYDIVVAESDFTVPFNVELLILRGTGLTGTGGDAAETFFSQAGANTMSGGGGNDEYLVSSTGDRVVEVAGGGYDNVYAYASWAMSDNVEALYLRGVGLTGTGTAGADLIGSEGGNNTLSGGAGDDAYLIANSSDTVVEQAGGGYDVIYARASFTMGENVDALYVIGTGLVGTGSSGADLLIRVGSGNTLRGGGGGDFIKAGAAADVLTGGAGGDAFFFTAANGSEANKFVITDFDAGSGDYVSLKQVDANTLLADDQDFVLVSSFTNQAGQLIVDQSQAGLVRLLGDTNGDGVADLVIDVQLAGTWAAGGLFL